MQLMVQSVVQSGRQKGWVVLQYNRYVLCCPWLQSSWFFLSRNVGNAFCNMSVITNVYQRITKCAISSLLELRCPIAHYLSLSLICASCRNKQKPYIDAWRDVDCAEIDAQRIRVIEIIVIISVYNQINFQNAIVCQLSKFRHELCQYSNM